MRVIKKPDSISSALGRLRKKRRTVGFVPTMGALHEGHLSLIRRACSENDTVVVSIFVNPKQFGPKDDLKKYPRPLSRDLALCKKEGVDFVFLTGAQGMYPEGFSTYVEVDGLSSVLCGKYRPGHFRGVATVVAKLLNIVQPATLYLGQKDAQQAVIIRRMVKDLNFPVKVKVKPTVREKDGLALSSRNAYLTEAQRKDALALAQALKLAKVMLDNGAREPERIISRMRQVIRKKALKIDYIEIVDPDSLKPVNKIAGKVLIALAVRVGKTRLIDNLLIDL